MPYPAEMSATSATEFLRASCVHCQGGIEFPHEHTGSIVPCPHCGKDTVLRTGNPSRNRKDAACSPARKIPPIAVVLVGGILLAGIAAYLLRGRVGQSLEWLAGATGGAAAGAAGLLVFVFIAIWAVLWILLPVVVFLGFRDSQRIARAALDEVRDCSIQLRYIATEARRKK
jgi:predicted RNA-binding Zn-ribbon protein involved in translation (DUF1610 family)